MSDLINFELLGAQMRMSREDEKIIRADERAKTIDEFAEKLKREHYALCAWQDEENFQYPSYLLIDDVYRHIDKVAEQLKEQKGGAE